jgi:hypothetical protein
MKYSLRSLMIAMLALPLLLAGYYFLWRSEVGGFGMPNALTLVLLVGLPLVAYRIAMGLRRTAP